MALLRCASTCSSRTAAAHCARGTFTPRRSTTYVVLAGRVRVYTLSRDGTTAGREYCCHGGGAGHHSRSKNDDNDNHSNSSNNNNIGSSSGGNRYVAIPPFVPHIFEFLEDGTTLLEWWDGPFEAWYYRPYRALVQDSLVEGGSLLLRQPPPEETAVVSPSSSSSSGKNTNTIATVLYNVLQSSRWSDAWNNPSKTQWFCSGLAVGLLLYDRILVDGARQSAAPVMKRFGKTKAFVNRQPPINTDHFFW